jgi:gluconokinase
MKEFPLRSPAERVSGIVYFGRMLDKIRVHAKGELPAEYQPNLGRGFDGRCIGFLGINYNDLIGRVKEGGSDEEILDWCFEKGRKPSNEEIEVWNDFMRKRGWNDEAAETLARRKKESSFSDRAEIQTLFNYIDADEGRKLRN